MVFIAFVFVLDGSCIGPVFVLYLCYVGPILVLYQYGPPGAVDREFVYIVESLNHFSLL